MSGIHAQQADSAMPRNSNPYKVLVVDDSAVIRGLISRWLEQDPEIKVVSSAGNGLMAIRQLQRTPADVVVLDIEMPEMDGITALPKLLEIDPKLKVVMASTLTRRNAEISLRALEAGASDYVPKPSSTRELQQADVFRRELVEKVKALGAARRLQVNSGASAPLRAPRKAAAAVAPARQGLYGNQAIALRKFPALPPKVLAIGSSTGGPQALFEVFGALRGKLKLPVFVTQHMPATFTAILSEHIAKILGTDCHEAVDGEPVEAGKVYVAPGDWHMTVAEKGGRQVIALNQNPPENFCRPSVDPMLRSLVSAYGGRVLTVILTGMGHDGLEGSRAVTEAGGCVIAQDEASSVVWGMPGAVASGGLCSAVLPLKEVGPMVEKIMMGAAR